MGAAKIPRNRARMPQERGKKMPETAIISARVSLEHKALVLGAANCRGWTEARVVEEGAVQRAREVLAATAEEFARVRTAVRQAKSRVGGLARAAKKRNT